MQLLIGFETGLIVLWDLREKTAEFRYNATEVCVECSFSLCQCCSMVTYANHTRVQAVAVFWLQGSIIASTVTIGPIVMRHNMCARFFSETQCTCIYNAYNHFWSLIITVLSIHLIISWYGKPQSLYYLIKLFLFILSRLFLTDCSHGMCLPGCGSPVSVLASWR